MFDDPAIRLTLLRTGPIFLAMLGAFRIMWVTFRQYNTKPEPQKHWTLAVLGAFLFTASYVAILAMSGGTSDVFVIITSTGPSRTIDYVFLLKAGWIIALLGAFSASKYATRS